MAGSTVKLYIKKAKRLNKSNYVSLLDGRNETKNNGNMDPLRNRLFPHSISDAGAFLLLILGIPVTFVFAADQVLPALFSGNTLTTLWVLGCFLMFNLKGNIIYCMIVDTSIRSILLTPPRNQIWRRHWRYCSDCQALSPPRSWHCQFCRTCILKRDHHCVFMGCCIGHNNYRYFFYVMLYVAIGATAMTILSGIYLWYIHAERYANFQTIIKMGFPILIFAYEVSWENLYLFLFELNAIAAAYCIVLMAYHIPLMLRGSGCHERKAKRFNLGARRNLEMIFGENWWMTWISPFIYSKLPHDGIHWETILNETIKQR